MIVLTLDRSGLLTAEIVAPTGAQPEYHKLFTALRAALAQLDEAVKAAAVEVASEQRD